MSRFGLVMYQPTQEEVDNISSMVKLVNKTKPCYSELSEMTRWFVLLDEKRIKKESHKSFGWNIDIFMSDVMIFNKDWVQSLFEINNMLKINKECYITPLQAKHIKEAFSEFDKFKW